MLSNYEIIKIRHYLISNKLNKSLFKDIKRLFLSGYSLDEAIQIVILDIHK